MLLTRLSSSINPLPFPSRVAFSSYRDLLQIADISAAIKRLSLQAMPGTENSSPLNSDRSLGGERRGIQFKGDDSPSRVSDSPPFLAPALLNSTLLSYL